MVAEYLQNPGRVIARLARQVEVAAATVDLTLSQYRVLGTLGDGSEAASGLAEKLAVSRPSITGVVDGLVARGLVTRAPVGHDRRRIDLALTDTGRELLATADAEVQRRLDEITASVAGSRQPSELALGAWRDALDAHRDACRARRKDAIESAIAAAAEALVAEANA